MAARTSSISRFRKAPFARSRPFLNAFADREQKREKHWALLRLSKSKIRPDGWVAATDLASTFLRKSFARRNGFAIFHSQSQDLVRCTSPTRSVRGTLHRPGKQLQETGVPQQRLHLERKYLNQACNYLRSAVAPVSLTHRCSGVGERSPAPPWQRVSVPDGAAQRLALGLRSETI